MEELSKIKYKIETLQKQKEFNLGQITNLTNQLNDCIKKQNFIIGAREYYKRAVDLIYERSIGELKDVLNSALSFIFYDEDYSLDIELSDKRGKSLNFRLYQNGKPVNLKRGTGMGIKTVISAVLHLYYLQCKNSKILMLDEAYSAISEEYIENFFEFFSNLAHSLKFKIIMITHDKRFLPYGDKYYIIDKGVVRNSC